MSGYTGGQAVHICTQGSLRLSPTPIEKLQVLFPPAGGAIRTPSSYLDSSEGFISLTQFLHLVHLDV